MFIITNKLSKLGKILFNSIALLTIILILILISGNKEIIHKFLFVYGINFLLILIYIPISTFFKLKALNKEDVKNKVIKFIKYYICWTLILGLFSIIFKSKDFSIVNLIAIPFGASFGYAFGDLFFKINP